MSYQLEKLDNESIVIMTWPEDFDPSAEFVESDQAVHALLNEVEAPVFLITDIHNMRFDLQDIMVMANVGARGEEPTLHHPNLRQMIVVSQSKLLELSAKGMKSPVFGNLAIEVVPTLDDALAFARANL